MPVNTTGVRTGSGTAVDDEDIDERSAEELLAGLKALPEGNPKAALLQERVLELYRPLLYRIARHYSGRGEPYEDLRQTAHLGLVKAIHGYDPHRGKKFISYLLPTVTGEIKRHFRDHTWAVRVPRRHQEQRGRLHRAVVEFQQRHAREPGTDELAAEMGLPEEEIRELLQASQAYSTLSLDLPDHKGEEGEGPTLEERIGREDDSYELVVERESLRPAMSCLNSRERTILHLRFFAERTQAQIADEIGCSQMHVSRLLAATLDKLRRRVDRDDTED
ncbi:SigB/SigF/SigG family RNA polymerase sigma factor [Nocardiopsis sp. N85]|uniref:SigB/SigF/SigG family RNA polymerase sigma factor n=1 Tax=Nocardiopsis sp. N85 TaxID=3029400 RepID=UPI00237F7937|nr:SigB/SigF/SigG family RNA polymerase sigma factor [Nocardiopsis sp. N85]MDE3724622.1 SigB/SigF/SigG family RNA polymerase sigma factor [Nocardiopsis sp. N85]